MYDLLFDMGMICGMFRLCHLITQTRVLGVLLVLDKP